MARSICLVLGYASLGLSLLLPTNLPSTAGGFYRGWESFFWPIMLLLGCAVQPVQALLADWSLSDVIVMLRGLMNIWLLGAWLFLFSKSAVPRLLSAVWGYAWFVFLVIRDAQSYFGFSAIDVFLYLSFLFVATGTLLSVRRT